MIAVIDYGMGNLGSILNMLRRLGFKATATCDPTAIERAERLILPGVGAFDQGMRSIEERGLRAVLDAAVLERRTPILGICLGMQLLGKGSEEGQRPGLGWIDGFARRFTPVPEADGKLAKVPQMGWNYVVASQPHPLFAGLEADSRYYFVHSFHMACERDDDAIAKAWYAGAPFVAAVGCRNIAGVQFHPEKSHRYGMQLLKRFAAWHPAAEPAELPL